MRMQRPFTLRRAMEVAIDTARGLAYMHNRKPGAIIHRDLKPGNLMISGSQYHSRWGSSVQVEVYLKVDNPGDSALQAGAQLAAPSATAGSTAVCG